MIVKQWMCVAFESSPYKLSRRHRYLLYSLFKVGPTVFDIAWFWNSNSYCFESVEHGRWDLPAQWFQSHSLKTQVNLWSIRIPLLGRRPGGTRILGTLSKTAPSTWRAGQFFQLVSVARWQAYQLKELTTTSCWKRRPAQGTYLLIWKRASLMGQAFQDFRLDCGTISLIRFWGGVTFQTVMRVQAPLWPNLFRSYWEILDKVLELFRLLW